MDLKFITAAALADRVETPRVIFDRGGTTPETLSAGTAEWPARTAEWFEARFELFKYGLPSNSAT